MSEAVRPLGLVSAVVAEMGLEVTYVYDDLVFISHNAFLLQFTEAPGEALLHFNVDCPDDEAVKIREQILALASAKGLRLVPKGKYQLAQGKGENMDLKFI